MSDTVTLTRQEYQDLIDARDHAIAMRNIATGVDVTIPEAEMDAYLAAPSPLAFWRQKRSLTQAALATQIGISQPYLAQLEGGKRTGDVNLFAKLAKALGVPIEALVVD